MIKCMLNSSPFLCKVSFFFIICKLEVYLKWEFLHNKISINTLQPYSLILMTFKKIQT